MNPGLPRNRSMNHTTMDSAAPSYFRRTTTKNTSTAKRYTTIANASVRVISDRVPSL